MIVNVPCNGSGISLPYVQTSATSANRAKLDFNEAVGMKASSGCNIIELGALTDEPLCPGAHCEARVRTNWLTCYDVRQCGSVGACELLRQVVMRGTVLSLFHPVTVPRCFESSKPSDGERPVRSHLGNEKGRARSSPTSPSDREGRPVAECGGRERHAVSLGLLRLPIERHRVLELLHGEQAGPRAAAVHDLLARRGSHTALGAARARELLALLIGRAKCSSSRWRTSSSSRTDAHALATAVGTKLADPVADHRGVLGGCAYVGSALITAAPRLRPEAAPPWPRAATSRHPRA